MTNIKARSELKGKLDQIEDKEEFFRQLIAPDVAEFSDCHVIIARDYILVYKDDIFIYAFADMEKVEVGIQGEVKKVLFLTDWRGNAMRSYPLPKETGCSGSLTGSIRC